MVLLAPHLLARLAAKERLDVPAIGECAMRALVAYDWPENVRQLETVLHVALVMAAAQGDKAIVAEHLPPAVRGATPDGNGKQRLDEAALRRALDTENWVIARVAARLEVDRQTVYRKMKQYAVGRPARPQ